MGDIRNLIGKAVYLDANIFIYAIEEPENISQLSSFLETLFGCIDDGKITAMTSELTLSEVLVGAYNKSPELIGIYDELITDSNFLKVYGVDRTILKESAVLRSLSEISLADAVHVATAIVHDADAIITNDIKMQVPDELEKFTLCSVLNEGGR